MLPERRIEISGRHEIIIGAPEWEAVEIFRSITPEDVSKAHNSAFRQNSANKIEPKIFGKIMGWQYSHLRYGEAFANEYPYVSKLNEVLALPFEHFLVKQSPEKFRKLISQPDLDVDSLTELLTFPLRAGLQYNIRELTFFTFTPREQRSKYSRGKRIKLPRESVMNILPDFSSIYTPKASLDAVISLTLDHDAAMQRVSGKSIQELADLKQSDRDAYREFAMQAGKLLMNSTFVGILNGLGEGESENIYKPRPDIKQRTERGICPGAPFVDAYFHGVGIFLRENYDEILTSISPNF